MFKKRYVTKILIKVFKPQVLFKNISKETFFVFRLST